MSCIDAKEVHLHLLDSVHLCIGHVGVQLKFLVGLRFFRPYVDVCKERGRTVERPANSHRATVCHTISATFPRPPGEEPKSLGGRENKQKTTVNWISSSSLEAVSSQCPLKGVKTSQDIDNRLDYPFWYFFWVGGLVRGSVPLSTRLCHLQGLASPHT